MITPSLWRNRTPSPSRHFPQTRWWSAMLRSSRPMQQVRHIWSTQTDGNRRAWWQEKLCGRRPPRCKRFCQMRSVTANRQRSSHRWRVIVASAEERALCPRHARVEIHSLPSARSGRVCTNLPARHPVSINGSSLGALPGVPKTLSCPATPATHAK